MVSPQVPTSPLYPLHNPLHPPRPPHLLPRPWTLILASARLSLFAGLRIATFILRAIEAHQASQGVVSPQIVPFVVEQIFLGTGFIVLATNLVSLVRSHLTREDVPRPSEQLYLVRKMQPAGTIMILGLIAAVVLGIIAGAQYSSAISDPSVASESKSERLVSSALTLVVCILAFLLSVHMYISHPSIARRSSVYLALTSLLILIIPAYRIGSISSSTNPTLADLLGTKTKAEFWVLQVSVEWVALTLLCAVDIRTWFGAGGRVALEAMGQEVEMTEEAKRAQAGEYAIGA